MTGRRRHLRLVTQERIAAMDLYGERSGTVEHRGTSSHTFSVVESDVPHGMSLADWRTRPKTTTATPPGATGDAA